MRTTINFLKNSSSKILKGVDNICIDKFGNIYVAEDGSNLEIIVLLKNKNWKPEVFFRMNDNKNSEIAGIAFKKDMSRFYFSSQRGLDGISKGITYEMIGNFSNIISNF